MDNLLNDPFRFLIVASVLVARPLGFSMIFPLFVRAQMSAITRAALALAISVPALSYGYAQNAKLVEPSMNLLAGLVFKEVCLGALIGFLMATPFWAIQIVGEFSDSQRGVSNSYIQDVTTKAQSSVTNEFLTFLFIAIFLYVGGLRSAIDTIYESYKIWPAFNIAPHIDERIYEYINHLLDNISTTMISVAGPIIVIMLTIDISMLFISRLSQQLRTEQIAIIIKNIVFVIVFIVYITLINEYIKNTIETNGDLVKNAIGIEK